MKDIRLFIKVEVGMFQKLKDKYQQYRHQKTRRQLRGHFLFFGHDLSHLTDEEIEQGVYEAGKHIANAGVTVKEACIALEELLKNGAG